MRKTNEYKIQLLPMNRGIQPVTAAKYKDIMGFLPQYIIIILKPYTRAIQMSNNYPDYE
jgi:hypothetical protein